MRKYIQAAAVAAAGCAMAGGVAAASMTSASAAPMRWPVPKIQSGIPVGQGWHRGWKVRPNYIYMGFGAGYSAPRMTLHWLHYNQHDARATGKWLLDNCKPSCAAAGHFVPASAHFFHVYNHAGPGRNFAEVTITWHRGHWHRHAYKGGKFHAYIDSHGDWTWH